MIIWYIEQKSHTLGKWDQTGTQTLTSETKGGYALANVVSHPIMHHNYP